MKKTIITLVFLLTGLLSYSQTASRILVAQSTPTTDVPTNVTYIDYTGGDTKFRVAVVDSILKNPDWNASTGKTKILNKPSLATVATTGNYTDLSGKPSLATVATSGSYNDLSNKPTIPTIKRIEPYSGTTNGSGVYTVTFPVAFTVAPNIQASIPGQSATNQYVRISSVTTTGFTVNAYSFNTNNLLGIISLITTTSNIASLPIDVVVFEK